MDSASFDFLTYCTVGAVLRTRDRRAARIIAVDRRARIIQGEIQMQGPCRWRADGRYLDAPAGAAGPWDLMPPVLEKDHHPEASSRASLAEALQNPDPGNPGCCD
jgi:hypothetical protein